MSTLDEITQEKQRVSEALARIDAQREKLAGQLAELEATERVLARYSTGTKRTVSAKSPPSPTKAVAPAQRQRGRRRSGACLGNRQNAAGNRLRLQGGSPDPCRRGLLPAQAGWPHRRARRK